MNMKTLRYLLLASLLVSPLANAAGFYSRAEEIPLVTANGDNSADLTSTAVGGISVSNTAAKIGSNGFLTTDATDYYPFTVTTDDICNNAEGELAFWIQFKTSIPTSGRTVGIICRDAGSSRAQVEMGADEEFRIRLTAADTTTIILETDACDAVVDTWYYVVAKWKVADDDRSISCQTDVGGGTLSALVPDTNLETDLTTDLAAAAPGDFNEVRVGNPSAHTDVVWVDNVLISTTYGTGLEDYAFITSYIPTYSTAPADGTFTDDSLVFTYTPDQKGTSYGAACTNGETIATGANVEAGTCSGGAALGTGSDASLAATADTLTIGSLAGGVIYDSYMVHKSGLGGYSTLASLADRTTLSGVSAVQSFTNEDRIPDAGQAIQELLSVSTTSPFDLDSYYTPDVAAADVIEYDVATPENTGCTIAFDTSGDFTMSPASAGDCDDKRTIGYSVQDYSNTTTGLFTAPAGVADFETDDLICNSNTAPYSIADEDETIILLIEDEAMVARDLLAWFDDDDALTALTITETGAGTLPAGTVIVVDDNDEETSETPGTWSGTPTTEDESGQALQATATDECGATATFDFTVYVSDDAVTAPDCVGDVVSACLTALETLRPWLDSGDQLTATFAYSDTVAVDDIISQNPAAAATLTATDALAVVVSLGIRPPGRGKRKTGIGLGVN